MWPYGHHFRTETADDGHMTKEYGVEVKFDQSIRARHCDQNLVRGMLGYIREIQETMKWIYVLSNVLFLGASGGTPLIGIM